MKTTIELPDPLLRRVKVLAAQRDTTLRELVIEGLRHVTGESAEVTSTLALRPAEAAVAETGRHGLPVLRRPKGGHPRKVTRAMVDRLRDELAL